MKIFDEEEISSYPDLSQNQGLIIYNNRASQQNVEAFKLFPELLKQVRPKKILEIGTGCGGLIHYIKSICVKINLDAEILTYDIHNRNEYVDLRECGIEIRVENIFNPDYTEVTDPNIIEFISGEGTTLVLCDGGSKIGEFNLLSKYLKPGDIIMAHDYSRDEEYFNTHINGKYWNWLEIKESDIIESVTKYNLKPFMEDLFYEGAWVCKQK